MTTTEHPTAVPQQRQWKKPPTYRWVPWVGLVCAVVFFACAFAVGVH